MEALRRRAVAAEHELAKLKAESGIDEYKARCDQQVLEANQRYEKSKAREEALRNKIALLESEIRNLNLQLKESCKGSRNKDAVISDKDQTIEKLHNQLNEANGKLDIVKAELAQTTKEKERVLTELASVKEDLTKRNAQVNRDYTTSSKPSSFSPNHSKIHNSREPTGRSPGAQIGHPHWGRRILESNCPDIHLDIPEEVRANPGKYRKVGEVVKQLQDICCNVFVTNYVADVYEDMETGKIIKSAFPAGMKDEVTYGPGVRAMIMFLNHCAQTSLDHTIEAIENMSDGKISPSKGWCNQLSKEFAIMTERERMDAFAQLKDAHTMHIDNTMARVNGHNYNITVCASGPYVLYFFRTHKGHNGIKGTPAEITHAILIHDHDVTFFSYGSDHQECLAHVCRYLKDSIANEQDLKWNVAMLTFVQGMLHEAKECDRHFTEERIQELEKQYHEILNGGAKEYEQLGGHKKGYPEGFNLMVRMKEYSSAHLLFLRDPEVDPTNNVAESLLRVLKRKLHQVTTFRSIENLITYCQLASFFALTKRQGKNIFRTMVERYGDMFAESADSVNNEEYREWMQLKKRDMNNLLEQERRNAEIEEKHSLLETARRSINGGNRSAGSLLNAAKKDYQSFNEDIQVCMKTIQEASKYTYITGNRKELLKAARAMLDMMPSKLAALNQTRKCKDIENRSEQAMQKMIERLDPAIEDIAKKEGVVAEEEEKLKRLENTLRDAEDHQRLGQIKQTKTYISLSKRKLDIAKQNLNEAQTWKTTVEATKSEAENVMKQIHSRLDEVVSFTTKMTDEFNAAEQAYSNTAKPSTRRKSGTGDNEESRASA